MVQIKKAIFPIAGLGTRFLPLSKAVPKELLPLVDRPLIQYLLEEAMASGLKEAVFITRPNEKKEILDYFKKTPKLEKVLKERKRSYLLEEIEKLEEISQKLSFSWAVQKEPLGDGHAVLQARKLVGDSPCGVFFNDDIIDSQIPCFAQLLSVFKTCQRPIIALKKVPKEKISQYGIVRVEKITSRVYKIKKIIEKPCWESAPSDLAVVGRYIITPDVFTYLKKASPNEKGEIILADSLESMVKDGKVIYGYKIEGEWLECGSKLSWLESNFYLSLNHPQFGKELKEYLKKNNW
jgi:UTP--glucose-1-phosphate uridylyltransferase